MISCIIIEDQPPAQRILQKFIGDVDDLDLKGTFADPLEALQQLKKETVDLIFLDIHLPKISGMDFLALIPSHIQVILTTAFSDYAIQSYELDIVDYLLKPFSFQRFLKAISKVKTESVVEEHTPITQTSSQEAEFIFIKSGHDYVKVDMQEIRYVKSEGDYTSLFLREKKYLVSYPLKFWLEKLPTDRFCQVHKSYLIHIAAIDKVSGNQIYLQDTHIPIGRAYKDYFYQHFLNKFT